MPGEPSFWRGLAAYTANAVTPEQLVPYGCAMSGIRPVSCGGGLAYVREGRLVLAAWPENSGDQQAVDAIVAHGLSLPSVEHITTLSPLRPSAAPRDAVSRIDRYWLLPLPADAPGQKVRNMLTRAARELSVTASPDAPWTDEHECLIEDFVRSRPLGSGTPALFRRIGGYLEQVPDALLFSARSLSGRLEGFCVGDCSALSTAFYLFAFRRPGSPPGTADLLLSALAEAATLRGHCQLNLGLGINGGIEFFKRKWGAFPFLPCVETVWTLRKKPWWRKWL